MTENRTSAAAHSIQFFDEDNLKNPFDIQLKAIIDKYARMEKALKESQLAICSEYCGSGSHVGYCLNATEALAFDPLS